MKQKIILSMFIALLLLSVIPMQVMGASVTKEYGFESSVAGAQVTYAQSTFFSTAQISGTAEVSTAQYNAGTKSYKVKDGSSLFTFSLDAYLTNFTFYIRSLSALGHSTWTFYNSSLGAGAESIIVLWFHSETDKIYYYNEAGATVQLWATNDWESAFVKYGIRIDDNLGETSYLRGASWTTEKGCRNPSNVNDGYIIDRLSISNYLNEIYLDDITAIFNDSYYGGISGGGCVDTTGMMQVGRFGYGSTDVDSPHISCAYNIPVSTTMYAVELQISTAQFEADSDMGNYECSVNGISLGMPTCSYASSYFYVLEWEANLTLTNEMVNFDFYHSHVISGTQYWDVGCGVSSSDDINNDGKVEFYWQDSSVVYHWEWILGIPFFVPTYGSGTTRFARDVAYRWWCSGFSTESTYDFTDTLGLSQYSSYNSTGYIYNLTRGYGNVMGAYTLGNPAIAYTLHLYIGGVESNDYGFPFLCRYPGDGFGFAPDEAGTYVIGLNNATGEVLNVTAYVVGNRSDYSIWTNPVISNQYAPYTISYRYYHPQGYSGGIAMDIYLENLNRGFTYCTYQKSPITNNASASFTYESTASSPEYWGLFTHVSSYTRVAQCTHYIRLPSVYDNTISSTLSNYRCKTSEISSLSVELTGTHMFVGGKVEIWVNGVFLIDVGSTQQFVTSMNPLKFGVFNATLYLNQNGTLVYLASCQFTVSPSDLPEGGEETDYGFGFIPKDYYPYIAMGIIIGFMLAPMFFVYSMNQAVSKYNVTVNRPGMVMTVISAIMGITGFVLSILLGLLEWWTVFVVIFIMVLIIVILWLKGGSAKGE